MSKADVVKVKGVVRDVQPGSMFKVELCDDNDNPTGHEIRATISGKLRMNLIKILRGDMVDVEVSVYDLKNGRITWRYK